MAVKIRLARRGRKKLAMYDVVVADARAPRDGRFIEKLGTYNPLSHPAVININDDKAFQWIMNGAQPTDTVKVMLSDRGILLRKHLQIGVLKGAISQDDADTKLAAWLDEKTSKSQQSHDTLSQTKAEQAKARREAEIKIKEARAEAIRVKNTPPPEPVAEPEPKAEVPAVEEAPTAEAAVAEETPAQETPAEPIASTEAAPESSAAPEEKA